MEVTPRPWETFTKAEQVLAKARGDNHEKPSIVV